MHWAANLATHRTNLVFPQSPAAHAPGRKPASSNSTFARPPVEATADRDSLSAVGAHPNAYWVGGRAMTKTLASAWVKAASNLGLDIVTPFVIDLGAERITVDVLLRDFGARLGMLIVSDYKAIAPFTERLVEAGFGYSTMSVESAELYAHDDFRDVLEDWGWSGVPEKRPSWLK